MIDKKYNADAIKGLLDIMAALRTPGSGCPWDIEQTFRSIAPYTIEEAYEVADAIERDDLADLKDELGDLLLQVVYHSRMAEEIAAFSFNDVVQAISQKMIRRHPHVFGSPEERAAGALPGFWARIKAEEKAAKVRDRHRLSPPSSTSEPTRADRSLLDEIPATIPALTQAVKLQNEAARVGFDWPDLKPVFDKMREELHELEHEVSSGADTTKIEAELGDLLFVMANVARHLKLDPEAALRSANQKFRRRFAYIERRLANNGRSPQQSDLAEMDALWDEAKVAERTK